MKKVDTAMDDELRPEYDLRSLRVRKVGPERKNFSRRFVQLEPDVTTIFPDSESVNEALRFLIQLPENISQHSLVLAITLNQSDPNKPLQLTAGSVVLIMFSEL